MTTPSSPATRSATTAAAAAVVCAAGCVAAALAGWFDQQALRAVFVLAAALIFGFAYRPAFDAVTRFGFAGQLAITLVALPGLLYASTSPERPLSLVLIAAAGANFGFWCFSRPGVPAVPAT